LNPWSESTDLEPFADDDPRSASVRPKESLMRCVAAALFACLTFAIGNGGAVAELPPSAYPDPNLATEQIDFKVLTVSKRKSEENDILVRWDVKVIAEVTGVRKTSSQLKTGSRIEIRYSAHRYKDPLRVGPGSHEVLEQGRAYSASLNGGNQVYAPGGAPYSTFFPLRK
jgi:hypothetical protein